MQNIIKLKIKKINTHTEPGPPVVFLCMKLLLISNDSFKYYYHLLYMILYSIQWQASHDNWS